MLPTPHGCPIALHCSLKATLSSEAATTRALSEYFKHARGRTRTAIRNGQVWEESLKRLRRDTAQTNVTGTETHPPPTAARARLPAGKSRSHQDCGSCWEPSPLFLRAGRGREGIRVNAHSAEKGTRAQQVTLPPPSEGTFVPFGIIPAARPLSRGRTKVNRHGLPVSNHNAPLLPVKGTVKPPVSGEIYWDYVTGEELSLSFWVLWS